jgi:hypothetical protein
MKTLRVAQITDIHLMAKANARLHGVDTPVVVSLHHTPMPDGQVSSQVR